MKLFPLFLFFLILTFGGWLLAHRGPDVWLHPTAITNTQADIPVDTSLTNTTTLPSPTSSTLPSPTKVQVVSATIDQVSIRWDPVEGASSYRIYRDGKLLGLLYTTSFTDLHLTSSTSYSYTVASVDALSLASVPSTPVSGNTTAQLATNLTNTPPVKTAVPTTPTKTTSPKTPSPTIPTPTSTTMTTTTVTPTPNTTTTPPATTTTTTPPILTTTPPPTTSTPPPPAASCGSGGACTAADVAAHATRGNCWVYLTTVKKVYNITAYVANGAAHPGGDVIVPYCGKDITAPFTSSAGGGKKHSSTALNSVLQAYYIGAYQ